jgi:hypothetical protein
MSLATLQASVPIRDVDARTAQHSCPIGRRIARQNGCAISTRSGTGRMPRHRPDRDTPLATTAAALRAHAPRAAVESSRRGAFSSG